MSLNQSFISDFSEYSADLKGQKKKKKKSINCTMADVPYKNTCYMLHQSWYRDNRFMFSFFLTSLGLPEDFGSIAKRVWGGFLTHGTHIICSSKTSCMKTKVDIVCFTLNIVFLIDPKNDGCAEDFLFFAIWSSIFSSFSSPFLLFPSYFLLLFTTHLLRIAI